MDANQGESTISESCVSPNTSSRHLLPQVATLAYNPKIAQSKATARGADPMPQTSDISDQDSITLYGATDIPDKVVPQDVLNKSDTSEHDKTDDTDANNTPVSGRPQRKSARSSRLSSPKFDESVSDFERTLETSSMLEDDVSPNINTDKATMDPADLKLPLRKRGRKPRIIHDPGEVSMSTVSNAASTVVKPPPPIIEEIPIKYSIGEMFWAKVSGHPWWACMISYYPFEAVYTRMGGTGNRPYRTYHVQFFGNENERGWIRENSLIAFEGQQKLEEHFASTTKKNKNPNMRLEVPSRRKPAWDIAVKFAMEAYALTLEERKQQYEVLFEPDTEDKSKEQEVEPSNEEETGTGTTRTKAKIKMALKTAKTSRLHGQSGSSPAPHSDSSNESSDAVPVVKESKSRKRRASGDSSPVKRKYRKDDKPSSQKSVRLDPASFEVFCQKQSEDVKEQHPDFDDEAVTEYLQNEWSSMSDKQRSRYKSRYMSSPSKTATSEDPDAGNRKSSRVRHSSSKVMEAEETLDKPLSSLTPNSSKTRKSRSSEVPTLDVTTSDKTQVKPVLDQTAQIDNKSETLPLQSAPTDSKQIKPSPVLPAKTAMPLTLVRKPITTSHEMELEISRLTSSVSIKAESLCIVCEKTGELVTCSGPCMGTFHTSCMGVATPAGGEYQCKECTDGIHTCYLCKQSDAETVLCSFAKCGQFYHESCVYRHPYTRQDGSTFICPQHVCLTCSADNPKDPKNSKGRLYRCVRCPSAYHVGDFCIPAGSINLPGQHIICSDHFSPLKTQSHHSHVNVSWCFLCNKGGTLMCCDSCPSAFHAECLKITSPDGKWFCPDCAAGQRPLYGDFIWVKLGNYRWWPGEICHPRHVPKNIQEKSHTVGEFPVHFLGSHEYFWLHRGRVFLFQEGDKGSKDRSNSKGLAKIFHKAVTEATEGYKRLAEFKLEREQIQTEKNDKKPAPYKFVKGNVPIGSVQIYKADISEIPLCECSSSSEHPCSKDSDCLNRMLMYECHPSVCPAGIMCENQNFTKRNYPESRPYKTEGRGWGLRTLVNITKGDFVNEYVGDLIDEQECKSRIVQAHDTNITNFYFLTLDKGRIIDAGPKGNYSRFMNHSCAPNLDTQKWLVNGDMRVGLFAKRDITAGEELTFNYNFECLGNEKTKCGCKAENCSGYLGVRPKAALRTTNVTKDTKTKQKKKEPKKKFDESCFRCGEGGELVMCDKTQCPRVYHLGCLSLKKPPRGKWVCPWHHCDECGVKADVLCSDCPNSFCTLHLTTNIYVTAAGKILCVDHEDLLKASVGGVRQATINDKDETSSTNGSVITSTSDSAESEDVEYDMPLSEKRGKNGNNLNGNSANKSVKTPEQGSKRGRRSKNQEKSKTSLDANDTVTPASRKKPRKSDINTSLENVKSALGETNGDEAMFSDEEIPSLVIDIPNVS